MYSTTPSRAASKQCEQCAHPFVPAPNIGNRQRFCCQTCSNQWHYAQRRHEFTCQHCKKRFKAKKPDRNKFCSRECAFAFKTDKAESKRKPADERECRQCGKMFVPSYGAIYCSDDCRKERSREKAREYGAREKPVRRRRCKECGEMFTPEYGDKRRGYCSKQCGDKHGRRIARATRRGRIREAGAIDSIDPIEVFERSKWKCYICGRKTPRELRGAIVDRAPELDHIIPLAKGGTHTYGNVACACRKCNQEKGSDYPA